eukprot:CAMPEP_0168620584 /NCGR_PEP_ID=MMETSP0449_2-20121227/7222_1 /TAXON_ID=1082188 /ORGANISM="Strombidium rassoulzadegani, Strain ras09" /LENGTH=55 /DNA_ID=CAMNT_0008661613 /DNA_START=488 /DNA_END=653 /DNA_ORIENTATION=-
MSDKNSILTIGSSKVQKIGGKSCVSSVAGNKSGGNNLEQALNSDLLNNHGLSAAR